MRWQKRARIALALFIPAFIAVVIFALRRPAPVLPVNDVPQKIDEKTLSETTGGLTITDYENFTIKAESQLIYRDGRVVYRDAALILPERDGRAVQVSAKEAEVISKPGEKVGTVSLKGSVKLTTSDGAEVTANDATYNDATGMLTVPGPVAFSRARMKGTGVGATYERDRDILWLLDQAHITVAPDAAGGGAMEATAGAVGVARADHYVVLTRNARITAPERVIEADEITVRLTSDDQRVQMLQLRGNSRITGGGAGAQSMSARDIDLVYGEDGRSLQSAKLVENAVVQLPGEGRAPGRRIAGSTIDMVMAPDGATVTSLTANTGVQVDLPADAATPARRIRSATLVAHGAPGSGLQAATFDGGVDFRETGPARGTTAALNRTARSLKLSVETKPGLGAIQVADFRGNVHITDGPDIVADAPRVIYRIAEDRMDLSPGEGDPGSETQVTDGHITVKARTIQLTPGTRKLEAETDVRSSIRPRRQAAPAAGKGVQKPPATEVAKDGKMPSMLKQDEPVNVTANRLSYDGGGGLATYSGNAKLWQGATQIQAATITLDDKKGNLTGEGKVVTLMLLTDTDPKSKATKTTQTIGRAQSFVYDDARRLATYTTEAHLNGAQGDVRADKLELYLGEGGQDLERAEAYGAVTVKEGIRTATGTRLTYTAAEDQYLMTGTVGTPVILIEETPGKCTRTQGTRLTFRRTVERIVMDNATSGPCTGAAR
jgi:lipopolysaccharide export system protein LptA